MLSSFRIPALTLTLTAGLVAAGCGADASLSPTGPSIGTSSSGAVMSDVFAGASEASAPLDKGGHGRVDAERGYQGDKDKDKEEEKEKEKEKEKDKDKGRGVDVNGRITAIDAIARTLLVGTHRVSVPMTATIRHGSRTLAFTALKVGDHVEVKGTLNATGVLVASEVKVEQGGKDDGEDNDLHAVELSGAVSALDGSCPALTFTVGKTVGMTVETTKVATTAATTFRGITCAAIANATVVEVKGTRQADGSVVATRVSVDDEDGDLNEVELSGAVSTLFGSCPGALTFTLRKTVGTTVETTKVATTATTTFREIACAAIVNGTVVEVKGTRQADGSIVATRVSLED